MECFYSQHITNPINYKFNKSIFNNCVCLKVKAENILPHRDIQFGMNTFSPTIEPTRNPTTSTPTLQPSISLKNILTIIPTKSLLCDDCNPTITLTHLPTMAPSQTKYTNIPFISSTNILSISPSNIGTITLTNYPTISPSDSPSTLPTTTPTDNPSNSTIHQTFLLYIQQIYHQ